jgi:ketosteroid isomerase-like protein
MSESATIDDSRSSDLEARLDRVESRFAIENLIAAYAQGFDTSDAELLHSIWHDDAVLDFGDAFGVHEGIDAIRKAADGFWAMITWMHHWQATPLIEIDGDRATAAVGLDCMVRSSEQGPVRVAGSYHDVYERRDREWKITSRKFEVDYWAPDPGFKAEFGNHL